MKIIASFILMAGFCSAQTWTQLPDLPGPQRDDGIACTIGSSAYAGTGSNGSSLENSFYRLDLSSNTWSAVASMPAGSNRQYASVFTYSNYIFVSCGLGTAGSVFSDTYRYDISANTWTTAASKPGSPVWGASSFTLNNKAYMVGGKFSNSVGSDEVWEYDMIANTWVQKNNFPFGARWRAGAAVLTNTAYLVFGLDNTGTGAFRKEIYKYAQGADAWSKVADFPQPNKGRIYSAMQALNNKLVIVAGLDSVNTYYNDCWFFDETNGFVQGPSLPSFGRKGGMSCSFGNKFYYTCGINVSNTRLTETWMLDVPVGIKEYSAENNFIVYPNPCSDKLFLDSFLQQPSKLCATLFDVSGRKILETGFNEGTASIDLSQVSKGIYFLHIAKNGTAPEIKKIIKE